MKITADNSIGKEIETLTGEPTTMRYLLNNHIEIEVRMPKGWSYATLTEVLKETFIEHPESIHILSIEKTILN